MKKKIRASWKVTHSFFGETSIDEEELKKMSYYQIRDYFADHGKVISERIYTNDEDIDFKVVEVI